MRYTATYLTPNGRSCRHFYRRSQGRDAREPETSTKSSMRSSTCYAAAALGVCCHGISPFQTVFYYFRKWRKDGTGKDPRGSSRSTPRPRGTRGQPERGDSGQPDREDGKGGPRGYDAGKKIQGRKRHILVDTLGLLLICVVHAANVQDRDGAKLVLEKVGERFPRLQRIWADGGYAGQWSIG